MVLRSMPASRKRKLSVPSTSKSGKPAAKPNANMRKLAGCKYRRSASRQVRTVAGGVLLGVTDGAGSDICGLSAAQDTTGHSGVVRQPLTFAHALPHLTCSKSAVFVMICKPCA